MERNHNEDQVVMSIESYNRLLGMAQDSQPYDTVVLRRHVRKFNPFLQAPHQANVAKHQKIRSEMIRSARTFKEAHVGKVVYAFVDMLGCKIGDDPVYLPVVVKRIGKARHAIEVLPVQYRGGHNEKYHYTLVSADNLQLEIPEDYIKGVGPYHKYMVKENGPYDVREAEARKEREINERMAAKKQTSEAVDVLVERREEE